MEYITDSFAVEEIQKHDNSHRRKIRSVEVKGLRKLFVDELKEIYWAEGSFKQVLHKMIKHSSAFELRDELNRQLEFIDDHQMKIGEVLLIIGEKSEGVKSKAVEGLIKEAEKTMDETKKGLVKDAGIISSAFKIIYYETATLGVLCFYARTLGEDVAAGILHKSLRQENDASEKLSQLIESISLETAENGDRMYS